MESRGCVLSSLQPTSSNYHQQQPTLTNNNQQCWRNVCQSEQKRLLLLPVSSVHPISVPYGFLVCFDCVDIKCVHVCVWVCFDH
mmetsp:Transcript_113127/g.196451  ORF Transcript_113127/g.196451 Transcript_113127/m.196451 type:complete len:84 (-) Transcript_113127:151-402(-)